MEEDRSRGPADADGALGRPAAPESLENAPGSSAQAVPPPSSNGVADGASEEDGGASSRGSESSDGLRRVSRRQRATSFDANSEARASAPRKGSKRRRNAPIATGALKPELEYDFASNSFRIKSKRRGVSATAAAAVNGGRAMGAGASAPDAGRTMERVRHPREFYDDVPQGMPLDDDEDTCCERWCQPPGAVHEQLRAESEDDASEDMSAGADLELGRGEGPMSSATPWRSWLRRLRVRLRNLWVAMVFESSWLFLCILGVASSILAWTIDEAVALLSQSRAQVASLAQSSVMAYVLWTLFTTLLALAAVFTTARISPLAAGSGIPQMRSMLSGFSIPGYLSLDTLASKVLGLLLALGSGMVIGKEGPFVHISCIIANQMLRLPLFAEIRASPALRKQVLAAACAVGVSSTFGAPIGGVLFSIEVTSSLYQTSEYWKGFFCVVCGAFVFQELSHFGQARNNVASLFTTDFEPLPYTALEIPLFVALAVGCGYLGGCFVLVQKAVADARQDPRSPRAITNPYSATVLVAVLCGTLNFPLGDFMQYSLHNAIDDLFVNTALAQARFSPHWDEPTVFINLLLFASIKFVLAALAVSLPIPCGIFTPLFAVGAALGRFFGEVLVAAGAHSVTAAGYSVIGGSAFVASATGSVSTAVIVFELTNQLSYMLPVLLAVLVGQATGRVISVSVYESLARSKNLPSFPQLRRQRSYALPVVALMRPGAACVPRFASKAAVEAALLRADNVALDPRYELAVVDSLSAKRFLGTATWEQLHALLRAEPVWEAAAAASRERERRAADGRGGRRSSCDGAVARGARGPRRAGGAGADDDDAEEEAEEGAREDVADLLGLCARERPDMNLPAATTLNDAINYFDVHKTKAFFVTRRGVVVGKLVLRDIAKQCEQGDL